MHNVKRKGRQFLSPLLLSALLLVLSIGVLLPPTASAQPAQKSSAVHVIPIKDTIESGLKAFLERAINEAKATDAAHIILVVNTYGGWISSADEIGHLIRTSGIPTTAFVEGNALSAGAFIALNADRIVMQPESTMGAAAVVTGDGELVQDPKVISSWKSKMRAAAEERGRDATIAEAMVDVSMTLDVDGISKQPGEILTLTAPEALKVGYSEHTASSVSDVIAWLDLSNNPVVDATPAPAENFARFLMNPIVMTVLFILGIAGIVIELIVPGFGAPGIIGLLAFGLYFFGSYVSGLAGFEAVVLFALGIILLIVEVFVPSHGIFGIFGGVALFTGILMASADWTTALVSLVVAVVIAGVIIVIFAKRNKEKGVWNKFILKEELRTEEGYVPAEEKFSLVGQVGVTVTALRPAGSVQVGNQRYDVVTGGEFIEAKRPVRVVKAEGTWIIVEEINN